jgi:hypothetical protein
VEAAHESDMQHTLTLSSEAGKKTWVAKLIGPHPKFGLDRQFVPRGLISGGQAVYLLSDDGIYEVCEADVRTILKIDKDGIQPISPSDALLLIASQSQSLDDVIARFNTEGGFSLEPSNN